jgi:multidrug efflux system membrane fusion protein
MKRVALWIPLALAACTAQKAAPPKTLTAVKVRQLDSKSAGRSARYSGSIVAGSRVELSFRTPGYVEALGTIKDGATTRDLQEGDAVTKGTELARLRPEDTEQHLSSARAALAEAIASKSLGARELERAEKLFGSGSISRAELDMAKARAQTAGARVQAASARVSEAQTAKGDSRLRAPIDGLILRRSLEAGALVTPGTPVFSIADTRTVKVLFAVADTELEALKVGSKQKVTLEAFRGRDFEGEISRIAPSADPRSHTFEVEVLLDNPKNELRVGMVAALQLPGAQQAALPLVPLTAVVRSATKHDGFAVFVVEGSEDAPYVRMRDVELQGFVGNAIPVKGGLNEGEQIVVLGAPLLSDGMRVHVIP